VAADATLKYLDQEDVGMDGLEYMYQDVLRGKNGVKTFPVNAQSRIIGQMQITKPEKGANLYLTINKNVQLRTEDAIIQQIAKIRNSSDRVERAPNARGGYAVAMEVDTGKVVAMASMPDYDPNVYKGGSIKTEVFRQIENLQYNGTIRPVYQKYDTQKEANLHPSSIVPLGSTQKPLTVLVGLAEGVISPNTTYYDRGIFTFGKKGTHEVRIKNSGSHAYGQMGPSRAIQMSSNTFMSEKVGNPLYFKYKGTEGVEVWDTYMKQFGLGVLTGSGLLGENIGTVDYFHEAETASPQSALIRASFGQQARYTVLQLAQYTAMLANHGKRVKPQFVEKIVEANGNTIQTYKTEVLNTVDYPDSYWSIIDKGMKSSVQGFDGVSYTFNRKTGTSEQQTSAPTAIENAVFIAYAPADKPKLAVAVVVPEGNFGGRGAAPIARQIFDAYDEEIGLYGTPRKPAENAASGKAAADSASTGTGTTAGR
jgi:penicillin-binding protein 2